MSVRYFQTTTGVAQYGNLTPGGEAVLTDAGYTELTAEAYEAAAAEQEAAAAVLRRPAAETGDPAGRSDQDG